MIDLVMNFLNSKEGEGWYEKIWQSRQ
jgi:hypothetical protein